MKLEKLEAQVHSRNRTLETIQWEPLILKLERMGFPAIPWKELNETSSSAVFHCIASLLSDVDKRSSTVRLDDSRLEVARLEAQVTLDAAELKKLHVELETVRQKEDARRIRNERLLASYLESSGKQVIDHAVFTSMIDHYEQKLNEKPSHHFNQSHSRHEARLKALEEENELLRLQLLNANHGRHGKT